MTYSQVDDKSTDVRTHRFKLIREKTHVQDRRKRIWPGDPGFVLRSTIFERKSAQASSSHTSLGEWPKNHKTGTLLRVHA